MLFSSAFVVFVFTSVALASPTRSALAVHEARQSVPQGFVSKGAPSADTVIHLKIGLTAKDLSGLETTLYEVSTPGSNTYGQHLSNDEVKAFVAPTPDTVSAVTSWLSDNGIKATTSGAYDDWLDISIPVSKANELFGAEFETFVHQPTGVTSIRTLSYQLPTDLFSHIDAVHPTTSFAKPLSSQPVFSAPIPNKNVITRAVPSSCATTITPICLQDLYGIPATRATNSTNKLGVSGFINQFPQNADLKSFLQQFRTDISSSTTFALQTLDGGSDPQGSSQAGIEANLDIQYTVGVATGVPVTFISVGESNSDGAAGFLDIITTLQGESAPPQVLTTSYGFNEGDLSTSIENKLCTAYMTLGARGVSILFASGDGGVSGSQSQSCSSFVPTFPSGCPFLTSVGATTGISPEVAASFSAGGFSNVFSRPSFQSSAVSTYLTALGSTNSGRFNSSGRAYPDVSAQGEKVDIVDGGTTGTVAGTSCSSPIFASIISLINDRLVSAGKPVLGFLNPFLYANPSIFTDITSGSNPGCNTNGFPAKTGWDPITGLGTPKFSAMLTAAGV